MKAQVVRMTVQVTAGADARDIFRLKEKSEFFGPAHLTSCNGWGYGPGDAVIAQVRDAAMEATGAVDWEMGPYWNCFDFTFNVPESMGMPCRIKASDFTRKHFQEVTREKSKELFEQAVKKMEALELKRQVEERQLIIDTIRQVCALHCDPAPDDLFYTPDQWAEREEEWGLNSVLIATHDGPPLAPYFNSSYGADVLQDAMIEALTKIGYYAEPCTCWYAAIYPLPTGE